MNLNIRKQIRQQTACCFERSRDALFELVDALSSEPQASSLPELSLSPAFRRKWGSVYEALQDGRINEERWSQVWTSALLAQHQGPVWLSVDSTSIARPEAETSEDSRHDLRAEFASRQPASERRMAVLDPHALA